MNGLFMAEIAVMSSAYGIGVSANKCFHGDCANAGKNWVDASTDAFGKVTGLYTNGRGKSQSLNQGKYQQRGSNCKCGDSGKFGGSKGDGSDWGYDPDGINFVPWIPPPVPWIPGVPMPMLPFLPDWNALLTRPDDTAQKAADEAPDQIDILEGFLAKNGDLSADLEDMEIIAADENGHIVDINWQDDYNSCANRKWYLNGIPERHKKGSSSTTRGGIRATYGAAYLCGELNDGHVPNGSKPWDYPMDGHHATVNNQLQYARCHLIGRQLGGSGRLDNLVTCLQDTANRQAMTNFENMIREYAKDTDILYLAVPVYNGSNSNGNDGHAALTGIELLAIAEDGRYWYACIENVTNVLPMRSEC
jgi:hypothetical protein